MERFSFEQFAFATHQKTTRHTHPPRTPDRQLFLKEPAIHSIKDIARAANVSIATVSRVINNSGYASRAARDRVMAVIKETGFSPNVQAINLVKKRSNIVGLLIPQIDNAFFARIIIEVEQELRRRGYNVMLCHTAEDEELEKSFLDILASQRVAGILATPVGINSAHYRQVVKNTPTVILARHFANLATSWVDLDNCGASYNIIRHLAEQGNRRILILSNAVRLSTNVDRLRGARQAARDFHLPKNGLTVTNTGLSFDEAYESVMRLFENGKRADTTAVYAFYTVQALAAMKALGTLGIAIPEQVALVSFNDMADSPYSGIISKALTGNRHPTREMCQKAIELLFAQIEGRGRGEEKPPREQVTFPPSLAERESSLCRRDTVDKGHHPAKSEKNRGRLPKRRKTDD